MRVFEILIHKMGKEVFMKTITAILMAAVMLLSFAACGRPVQTPAVDPAQGYTVLKASYPEAAKMPNEDDYVKKDGSSDWDAFSKAYEIWRADQDKRTEYIGSYESRLQKYLKASMKSFMADDRGENLICAPTNIYMALAMCAECAGGSTRQEILDVLGASSIDELRKTAKALWTVNYSDDGQLTSKLASSIWINGAVELDKSTIATLAADYYASVYEGDMTGGSFFEEFQKWLDEQTGGLLKDKIASLEPFKSEDVMVIATTIYFKGSWQNKFDAASTTEDIFYAESGKKTVDFMHSSDRGVYLKDKDLSAVRLPFSGNADLWVILPDEGVSPSELFASGRAADFILDCSRKARLAEQRSIILSLPKFDVSSSMQLKDKLIGMGMKEAFTENADFSPLAGSLAVYVSSVSHDARVKIDEEGCEAVAYTLIVSKMAALIDPPEEIEFNVNRPFIFAICGADGLPLFTGTVNDPQ